MLIITKWSRIQAHESTFNELEECTSRVIIMCTKITENIWLYNVHFIIYTYTQKCNGQLKPNSLREKNTSEFKGS